MQVFIELQLEVNIPKDRANANEIFFRSKARKQGSKKRRSRWRWLKAYEEKYN